MMAEATINLDGLWHPEEWTNGRWLLTRHVEHSPGIWKRLIHCDGKFSAFANIYESEDTAAAEAERLNEKIMEALIASATPPIDGDNKETEQ